MIQSAPTDRERVVDLLSAGSPAGGTGSTRQPLLLAPMADLTHAGLRTLIHEFGGCDLFLTEMISAESLVHGTQYERYYLSTEPDPGRLVYQLVGYTEDALVRAAGMLAESPVAGIDVNMGCSAPQIVRRGGGIAWMEDEARTAALVKRLRTLCPAKSLSVKLRLGSSDDPQRLAGFASRLQDAGLDFITLHPKTRSDGSARPARWESVRLLRERLAIPVVANGGVTGFASLQTHIARGGPGAVMIGRAAARAPWIFSYLGQRMSGEIDHLDVDLASVARRFFALLERFQPTDFLLTRTRRFLPYFASNLRFGHTLGARLAQAKSYESAKEEMFTYLETSEEARTFAERS